MKMTFKWLLENLDKLFVAGFVMIFLASVGVWIGNFSGKFNYLIDPSAIIGLIGICGICPMLVKWIGKAGKALWKLFKQALYELIYEITRAIQDAKNNSSK